MFYLSTTSRPSEVREISPLTRALDDVHDLEEFFDAVAFKQKINAAIAVFITTQKDAGSTFGRSLAPKGERTATASLPERALTQAQSNIWSQGRM